MNVNGTRFVRGLSTRAATAAGVVLRVLACFGLDAGLLFASSAGHPAASPAGQAAASSAGEASRSQLPDRREVGDPNENPAYYRAGPFLDGYHSNELPLDPDSPFYPSSATTRSGGYYSEQKLLDVERCGDAGCHPDIYDQWYESTHCIPSAEVGHFRGSN